MSRNVPSSSKSTRSALPRRVTVRGPFEVDHRERPVEPVLEQPFDDRDRPLGLHAEHRLAEASRR